MSEGQKFDAGKPDWSLVDLSLLEEMVTVLTKAAIEKYGRDNWQKVPDARNRYFAALQRHLACYQKGEWLDKDDHLPALAHAMCNVYFLSWFNRAEREATSSFGKKGTAAVLQEAKENEPKVVFEEKPSSKMLTYEDGAGHNR